MKLQLFAKEVVPVYTTELGNKVVNARELHKALGVKARFNDWFRLKVEEHKLVENQDYCLITQTLVSKKEGRGGDRVSKHYIVKLHSAKKIALGTNNEVGDKIKDYFIKCEEGFKQSVVSFSEYSQPQIQKGLVKQVNSTMYHHGGTPEIVEHHQENCKIHFGVTPSELRSRLVSQGKKVKSKSGREIAREIKPEAACSMAWHDDMVSKGHTLDKLKAMKLKEKLEPAFKAIMDLGFTPVELLR